MPIIQLDLDSSKAVAGLKKYDRAVDTSERKTTTSFDRMRKSANSFGKIAGGIGLAFGAAMIPLVKGVLSAASTMNETQGIFDSAFGGMMGQADAWSANLQENYHLSEQASKEYLSNLTMVTTGMGVTQQKAGELSNKLTIVAADLGAAFDKKTADVVRDIRSALSGSMETMDKYGVVIRQQQVAEKALAMNIGKTKDQITQADKALATYQLIMERTGVTAGTTAREFNGWAGQIAEAEKNIQNLAVGIGQALMPVFLPMLQTFNDWLTASDSVAKSSEMITRAIDFLADGFRGLGLVVEGVYGVLLTTFNAVLKLLAPFDLLLDGLVKLGAVDTNPLGNFRDIIGDMAADAVPRFIDKLNEATEKSGSFTRKLKETTAATKEASAALKAEAAILGIVGDKELAAAAAAKKLADEKKKVKDEANELNPKLQEAVSNFNNLASAADSAASSMSGAASSANGVGDAVANIGGGSAGGANKRKGTSGTGYFSSNAEKQRYNMLTPAGRGTDYYDRYGKYGKRGAGPNAYLDVIDNQSRNALEIMNGGGDTYNFNFNQQVSRSDITAIQYGAERNEARA